MRIASIALLFACLGSAALLRAADPADPRARGGFYRDPPASQEAGPRFVPPLNFGQPSHEELLAALAFLEEHSPRRAAVVREIVESRQQMEPRRQTALGRQVVMRFREMKMLEETDKPLYEIKLKQLRVEDEMFVEAAAIRSAHQASPENRNRLERAAMEFIDLRIEERKHLINKLQDALARDEKDKPKAARERMIREINGGSVEGQFNLEGPRGGPLTPATGP